MPKKNVLSLSVEIEPTEDDTAFLDVASARFQHSIEFDADEIEPYLHLGSRRSTLNREMLDDAGVKFMINLSYKPPHHEDIPCLTINVADSDQTDLTPYFKPCFEAIASAQAKQETVMVYCHRGISRSSTIVAAYLMYKHRIPWQEAINRVRVNRPIVAPNYQFLRHLYAFQHAGFDPDVLVANYEALLDGFDPSAVSGYDAPLDPMMGDHSPALSSR